MTNPNTYRKIGKFVKRNPVKSAAAAGFLHGGPVGAVAGAGVVKAYQNRKRIGKAFKSLKNRIKRR